MKIAKAIRRLSTETAFKVFQRSIELEKKGKKIIHLSLGQPDFKTPKNIVLAAKNALDKGYHGYTCLLYTSPSPRDATLSRMPSSA